MRVRTYGDPTKKKKVRWEVSGRSLGKLLPSLKGCDGVHPGPDVGGVCGADVVGAGPADLLAKVEHRRVRPGVWGCFGFWGEIVSFRACDTPKKSNRTMGRTVRGMGLRRHEWFYGSTSNRQPCVSTSSHTSLLLQCTHVRGRCGPLGLRTLSL